MASFAQINRYILFPYTKPLLRISIKYLLIVFGISFVFSNELLIPKANYSLAMKAELVYEVTNVTVTTSSYIIEGWAFVNESQHYKNAADIEGYIELVSSGNRQQLPITFESFNITYIMQMENRRRCGDSEYHKSASECYYDYEYVKFKGVIPFDQLKDNTTYTLNLGVHAKKTGTKKYIELLFVSNNPLTAKHNGRAISMQARLYQTYFYVNHDYVLARKSSSKTSAIYQEAVSCSNEFGKNHYFEKYTQFYNVKQVKIVDHISWYQVLTMHTGCSPSGMHYIAEGGINETWIPGTYVELNGSPATIQVKKDNTPPELYVQNPTIYVGDTSFRAEDYVTAFDLEDEHLTIKKGSGNVNINKVGSYLQEFSVTDSGGLSTSKFMIVKVIERPANTPPKIKAKNRSVYQYQDFDPLVGVTVTDLEEPNLINKIVILNSVDTHILGNHKLCFYVQDSLGLEDTLCVTITVIPYPTYSATTNLRFIDRSNLFYRESIPSIWIHNQATLEASLSRLRPIMTQTY